MSKYFCLPWCTSYTNISFTSSLKKKVSTSYIDIIIKWYKRYNSKEKYILIFRTVHFFAWQWYNHSFFIYFFFLAFQFILPFSVKVIFKKFSLPEWWIIKRGFKYELCIHLQTKAPHYSACGIIITTGKHFGGFKEYIHKWDFYFFEYCVEVRLLSCLKLLAREIELF